MTQILTIASNHEFERWLNANTWFEDAEVTDLQPEPGQAARPAEITLLLTETLRGSYVAGAERVWRAVRLRASAVSETTLREDLDYQAGNCCEGLELLDVAAGVGWRIDVPGFLDVRCAQVHIEVGDEQTGRFEPWISKTEFGLTQPGASTPQPEDWVRRFADNGVEVVWRLYGDSEPSTPPHPDDYTGWHLQLPSNLTRSPGGLMFFACGQRDGGFVLQLRLSDDDGHELRDAAYRILAGFPGSRIWCGNCQFSTEEWQAYLASGQLPVRIRG